MRIRIMYILVTVMLVLSLVSTALAASNAVINNPNPDDRLNLRTLPNADAPTLGKYYSGLDVQLLGPEENGWYKVSIGTLTGYMQAKFLETDPNKIVQPVTVSFTVNNTSGTGLNLRETQSTKSKSLGFYENGEIGYVLGVGETWCHVGMNNNEVGFMLRESLFPVPEFDKGSGSAGGTGGSGSGMIAKVNNPNPDDRLNLRTSPSADAPTLCKYYNGTEVTLLSSEENGWYKVKFGTLTGYMQAKFLETNPDKIVQSATVSFKVNNTSGTGLNLRESQSTKSKSLGLYENGEIGYVFGVGETWCHVGMADETMGFMLRESLSPMPVFDKGSGSTGGSGTGSTGSTRNAVINNPNPDDRLNLRTSPNADAPTLCKYYSGLDVQLLGPEENGWYKVSIGTLTGYMQAKFLETDPSKIVQPVTISFTVNNTSGTGLNLRETQSTKSKSLGFYENGEIGYVLGVGETWCHVGMNNNEVGFMLRESLSPVPVFDKGSGK